MAVKALLVILTALFGCNLYNSQSTNVWECSEKDFSDFSYDCSDSENNSIRFQFFKEWLFIRNDEGLIVINLTKFPKQNISQELRDNHKYSELNTIMLEHLTLPNGTSFGTLFEHFGIENEIHSFHGTNISSPEFPLHGRFSSGFEKVESLVLYNNNIGQLNEQIFQSMPELVDLFLFENKIAYLDQNVFQNLSKLEILDLNGNELSSLSVGMFDHQKHLKTLFLERNRLKNLTKEMFRSLDSLRELFLGNNSVTIDLVDDVFHHLPNLETISLGGSNMEVPSAIFTNQRQLKFVYLGNVTISKGLQLSGLDELVIEASKVKDISGLSNIEKVSIIQSELESLDAILFKNLTSTRELTLSSVNISNLADGLFDGLTELTLINISNNHLTNISGLVFRELQKVTEINLSNNLLTTIHPDALKNNKRLTLLNISNNQLTNISGLFRELQNLIEIDLSNNLLATIHPNTFENNKKVTTINLENNRLSFKDDKTPFVHVHNLKILNLSKNNLTRIPPEVMKLTKLHKVNLENNQISSVAFSEIRHHFINISSTYMTSPTIKRKAARDAHINLARNPLYCDRSMFDFLSKTDQAQLAQVFNNNCTRHFHSTSYISCPSACTCESFLYIGSDTRDIIFCNDKQLTKPPEIKLIDSKSIELDISNNRLEELPLMDPKLRVIFIQASSNQISKIDVKRLPSSLRGIDLSFNNIQIIAADVIRYVVNRESLEILFLKGNPLECHCSSKDTEELITFANENSSMTDLQEAKCDQLYELSMEMLQKRCEDRAIMISLIVVTILTAIFVLVLLLFIKHHQFIKMWLYAHGWFLWWVDEEYLDRDKVFDVFISYAEENQMLANRITYALEKDNIFKVCLHVRDFVVGEGIEKSVQAAVRNSRRTLVILSESYLESVWCEHEFHLAWERSVAERRKLIIAVKDGNLEEITDKIIQSYVKTHTYIESVDEWFWERLIFRLPHKRTIKNIFPIRDVIPLGAKTDPQLLCSVELDVKEAMTESIPLKETDFTSSEEVGNFGTPTETISAFTSIPV